MTLKYIREFYGVPAYRGARVRIEAWDGKTEGSITSGTHYVVVRPDPWPNARLRFHPEDVEYLDSSLEGMKRQSAK